MALKGKKSADRYSGLRPIVKYRNYEGNAKMTSLAILLTIPVTLSVIFHKLIKTLR